jgi:hypothetical protein
LRQYTTSRKVAGSNPDEVIGFFNFETHENTSIVTDTGFIPVFLIGILRGGVQLGPLDTEATNRPIVSAPGDYDDGEIGGMMIGRGN